MAVLFQQLIQTALGLVWLEDDDAAVGPFRDHAADLSRYAGYVNKVVQIVGLGAGAGAAGEPKEWVGQVAQWMYWWGIPIFQFFFASYVSTFPYYSSCILPMLIMLTIA